jgi:hypothetical protein
MILDIERPEFIRKYLNDEFWPEKVIRKAESLGYCTEPTFKMLQLIFETEILKYNFNQIQHTIQTQPLFDSSYLEIFPTRSPQIPDSTPLEVIIGDIINWLTLHAAIDPIINSVFIRC